MTRFGSNESASPARAATRPAESRTPLLDLSIGLVEDVRCNGPCRTVSPEDLSPAFQVCLPYRGVFVWHIDREAVVGDANQVLYVTAGESYRVAEPLPGGMVRALPQSR